MNQLNSKPPISTRKAFFAAPYDTVEDTLSTLSAVLIALTRTTAAAGPRRLSAVPTSVWSALNRIAATARRREKIIPEITLARITSIITRGAAIPAATYFIIRAPPSAPITMMPSRPILMTPLCSEKHPPSATSTRTDANISVYWINNNITPRPLSVLAQAVSHLFCPTACSATL